MRPFSRPPGRDNDWGNAMVVPIARTRCATALGAVFAGLSACPTFGTGPMVRTRIVHVWTHPVQGELEGFGE